MNHQWCSSAPRSLSAFRRASRLHVVPCTVRRMLLCLFRIGGWSCVLFLAYDHRLVVLRAGVEPAHGVGCTISYYGHSKNHEAMAGLVSVLGTCAIPCALTAELPKLNMKNGPTIFWLNHSTNIRQYSISTVTVKLCGQLAEVERVLPLVFRRRGVRQFATFEPLADEVA